MESGGGKQGKKAKSVEIEGDCWKKDVRKSVPGQGDRGRA